MYKITEFADMIGVTTKTLRNKHKDGLLIPTYIKPNSKHRFYSDESAYRYTSSKSILIYQSNQNNSKKIDKFKERLDSIGLNYKYFMNKDSIEMDAFNNKAIKDLLSEISKNKTYTVLYDSEDIRNEDLKLIKFYLSSCYPNIKIKDVEYFTFENSSDFIGGDKFEK